MWVPSKVIAWFSNLHDAAVSNAETVSATLQFLREDLTAVRAERDMLRAQLTVQQTNFDWLRMRVNQLEHERAALLTQVTGVQISAPELLRTPAVTSDLHERSFTFNDVGDDLAKEFGLDS